MNDKHDNNEQLSECRDETVLQWVSNTRLVSIDFLLSPTIVKFNLNNSLRIKTYRESQLAMLIKKHFAPFCRCSQDYFI